MSQMSNSKLKIFYHWGSCKVNECVCVCVNASCLCPGQTQMNDYLNVTLSRVTRGRVRRRRRPPDKDRDIFWLSSFQEGNELTKDFEHTGPPACQSWRESCPKESREAGVDVPEK